MTKFKINHTMINVKDMDRAIKFFTEILGFKLVRSPGEPPDPRDPRKNIKIAFITDGNGGSIELGCPAYEHISIGVEDIDKAVEELKSKGVEVAREPFPMSGGRISPIWLAGPDGVDGVWLEIGGPRRRSEKEK